MFTQRMRRSIGFAVNRGLAKLLLDRCRDLVQDPLQPRTHTLEADEDDDSGDNAGGDQNGSAVAQVAGASKFAFEKTAKMDEDSLAEAFSGMLKESAAFGASDLHISTGVRPFIRKNRSFSFLSEYVITPEDALRLNTALLSDGQKKIFKERKDYD